MDNRIEISEEIRRKHQMVKGLSEVMVASKMPSLKGVEYEYYVNPERGWTHEYVVVYYKGGACAPRNVSGDSLGAIVQEIAKLLYGGYYAEVEERANMMASKDWQRVDLNA